MIFSYLGLEFWGSLVEDNNLYELILLWQMALLSLMWYLSTKGRVPFTLSIYNIFIAFSETFFPSPYLIPFELTFLVIMLAYSVNNYNISKLPKDKKKRKICSFSYGS